MSGIYRLFNPVSLGVSVIYRLFNPVSLGVFGIYRLFNPVSPGVFLYIVLCVLCIVYPLISSNPTQGVCVLVLKTEGLICSASCVFILTTAKELTS